jgi:hypothetical protein
MDDILHKLLSNHVSYSHHYAHPFKPSSKLNYRLSIVNIYLIDVKPTVQISPATILVHVWKVIAIKSSTITLRSISTFSFAIASRSIRRDNYIFCNLNRLDIFKTYNSNNWSEVMPFTNRRYKLSTSKHNQKKI